MANITEYGEILLNGIDEWGGKKIDGLLEEGTIVIVAAPPPGWTHSFLGVANANIGNIMGVAKANIGNVSGVA